MNLQDKEARERAELDALDKPAPRGGNRLTDALDLARELCGKLDKAGRAVHPEPPETIEELVKWLASKRTIAEKYDTREKVYDRLKALYEDKEPLDTLDEMAAHLSLTWTHTPGNRSPAAVQMWAALAVDVDRDTREACKDRREVPHPVAVPLEAWVKRYLDVDRETRPDAILGAPLVQTNKETDPVAVGFQPFGYLQQSEGGQMYLPFFGPGEEYGEPGSPALPLTLWDLGPGALHEAPLALRIFVEACLSVPVNQRHIPGPVLLPRQTFGEFLKGVYRNPKEWRRGKDFGYMMEALQALESPEARIPWKDATGAGSSRRVVIPRDLPLSGSRRDYIQFAVDYPPGSERGPLIDRPALLRQSRSRLRYRLSLSLSFWWCKPGRLQVPVERGEGRKARWMQQTKPETYPEVSDALLVSMAYPADTGREGAGFRSRRYEAEAALSELVKQGFAAVAPRRRIYPGPKWAGWNYEKPEAPQTYPGANLVNLDDYPGI